jgi:tetratricopeptide (TPR) repeat protein
MKKIMFLLTAACAFPAAAGAKDYLVLGPHENAGVCYREAAAETMRPDALAFCDLALASEPLDRSERVATLVNRGVVKYRLGQLDAATADFDEVLAQTPQQPDALINKGLVVLARGGSPGEALAFFNAGIAGTPRMPWVGYYGRAFVFEVTRNDAFAYRDYKQAQALRPGWRPARDALARFTVR